MNGQAAAPPVADAASNATNGTFPAADAAGQTVAAIAQAETMSPEEIALYDRQVRLWGFAAQERIRKANILLVSIRALASEVAKNLVLAGIGSITLADHEVVTEDDLGAQFFISEADVGKNRAEAAAPEIRKLNPRVKVTTITRDLRAEQDVPFFTTYDIVIATDLDFLSFKNLDTVVRFGHRPFYAAASHGFYGYIFADLGSHDFIIEREKSNRPTKVGRETPTRAVMETKEKKENGKTIELVTKREAYSPLSSAHSSPLPADMAGNIRKLRKVHPLLTCIRTLWDYQENGHGVLPSTGSHADLQLFTQLATQKHKELQLPAETLKSDFLRSFLQNLGSELAPVTAFLGGQLAQDVINVLGKREQPLQNLMLFDGEDFSAPVYALHQANFNNQPVPALEVPVAQSPIVI
ncbi:hypothetical protein K491DRAFT_695667 [Lophiostoma macrostomum CBS 122681]|uniref:Ubiquitin-like 1-activating enzyme E1A n=1 Tax=Lophiostoma macrostomum CBS 122681 TaxID=1314788 RepID=A0A6A6SZ82_9PLEO|nr:hypothetical protein K491DRAFT_695667 [Lophiostoma macrostomum CBS 122681]